ncbi:MAG: VWA domain-containing protein [Deltaproteobacteria bacterium]|nr:VWA domain-containing protein [Deltaproteobacteria bacterium]
MTTALAHQTTTPHHPSSGGRLVATDGRALPLLSTRLAADAQGGLIRVRLEQRFANRHQEALEVTYLFPLPHDAAVSGFAIHAGGRRIAGLVEPVQAARERYEEALVEGRTAALLEQERGSLFTQSVGNVPPGEEVRVEIDLDQRLAWAEGAWEWRFPTAVAPRYLGAPGRVADAGRVTVDVAEGDIAPRLHLQFTARDALAPGRDPESPSHAVTFARGAGALTAALPAEGAPLDRDLVVRWPVALPAPGLSLGTCRVPGRGIEGQAYGLLTLVPPAPGAVAEPLPRDLVVLIDASGSMGGRPMEQARAVVRALVQTLGERDTLELISFASAPQRWKRRPARVDAYARRSALAWLDGLEAGGATEMKAGIREALRPVRDGAQRQVLLVTDGQIGFEQEIVAAVLERLPAGTRLHALGVGDAVNRSLTGPVARAGRGVEQVLGIDEDPARAAEGLLARTDRPLLTGLTVEGSALAGGEPLALPDLLAGGPALLPLALRPEGGALTVRGTAAGGAFERTLQVEPCAEASGNPAFAALHARERVEEAEMRIAAGEEGREREREIERLGVAFQIATRLTSWVAVAEEPTVDGKAPLRRERMPQMLPHGMSAEGLGLRAPMMAFAAGGPPPISLDSAAPFEKRRMSRLASPPANEASFEVPAPAPLREDDGITLKQHSAIFSPAASRPGYRATHRWVRGRLVIELELAAPLAWTLPAEVVVHLGAERVTCAAVAERSTGSGAIAAGLTVRLVLEWPDARKAAGPAPDAVELRLGGQTLVVPVAAP